MSLFEYDGDSGRFRWAETQRDSEGGIKHRKGEFASPNKVINQSSVTATEHGFRGPDGKFIPRDALEQSSPSAGAFERSPSAERLVLVDDEGRVQLIRAGGHGTDTETPEEITEAGIVSEALRRGFLTDDEYRELDSTSAAADLVRDMAIISQDVSRFGGRSPA